MTKTYSEQRQAILFKASRDLRAVACQVLDDVQNDVELKGSTPAWATSLAKNIADQANELENTGHEQCIGSTRAENALYRSHEAYSKSIDAFEARIRAARQLTPA